MRAILINGIADSWGSALARKLSTRDDLRLIGLDVRPPQEPVGRAEVLTAMLRGPQIVELLRHEQIETVVQVALLGEHTPLDSEETKRVNVIGLLELLGACLRTEVQRVIIRSSTFVYGPRIDNPAFIAEHWPLAKRLRTPWLRDMLEIEAIAATFMQRHPRPQMTILRFPAVVGSGPVSASGRFLTEAMPQLAIGFDPRMQVLYSDDALAALEHALDVPPVGAVNVAAWPPLPLSRVLRMVARPPHSALDALTLTLDALRAGLTRPPFDENFLRYGCIADTARMRDVFGFEPAMTAEETLAALRELPRSSGARFTTDETLRAFLARNVS